MISIGGIALAAIKSLQQNARAKRKGYRPDLNKKLRRNPADSVQLQLAQNKRESDMERSNKIRTIIFIVLIALLILPAILISLGYLG
jgi:hypothetical protein